MSQVSTPLSAAIPKTEAAGSQPSFGPGTSTTQTPRERSCVLCKQRKVKCDRKDPCFNCHKARVECVFRAPAPPRRRKKKDPEVDLVARLKRYEELLVNYGATVDVPDRGEVNDGPVLDRLKILNSFRNTPDTSTIAHDDARELVQQHGLGRGDGKLITGNGRSRYLERLVAMPSLLLRRQLTCTVTCGLL